MKEEVLLSIIIPVYNVQFYLEKCVKALTSQEGNFEIILVDDGSPDRSGEMCDELAKTDKRIRVFHKENGGVSSARNLGIENARGKYLSFIDSDDYVSPSYISSIFGYLKHNDCDLYIFNNFKEYNKTWFTKKLPLEDGVYENPTQTLLLYITQCWGFINNPWNKIFKKEILQKYNLSFDTSLHFGEDRYFNIDYMRCCKNFYICSDPLYFYFYNNLGAVVQRKLSYLDCDSKMFYQLDRTIKESNVDNPIPYINDNFCNTIMRLHITVHYVLQNHIETKESVRDKINSLPYIKELLNYKYTSRTYKNYYKKLKHISKGQWGLYFFDRLNSLLTRIGKKIKAVFRKLKISVKEHLKNAIANHYRKKKIKNRVVFISFGGEQYSDNPRAVSEKLHEISPMTQIVWLFKKPCKFKKICPKYVKRKKLNYINAAKYLSTSRVWVDNDYLVYELNLLSKIKTKNHLFIETWHGDKGIKRTFYSIPGYNLLNFSLEKPNLCDYFVVGSKFSEKNYPVMFRYGGKLLKIGSPRNDQLLSLDPEKTANLKKKMGVSQDTKILLYAPTYRGNDSKADSQIDFDSILALLKKKYDCEWVLLSRAHHMTSSNNQNKTKLDFYANTLDMADLLCVTDILISDYSSCIGDFVLTQRPAYLYIDDYKTYQNVDKGFHFDLLDSPYKTATNQAELEKLILDDNPQSTKKNSDDVLNFYGDYESGHASEKVCEVILEKLNEYKK